MRRRVKITGIGPVTPAGTGRQKFFDGINQSFSHITAIRRLSPELQEFIGAEIKDFDLAHFAPQQNVKRVSRHAQFAIAAAVLALEDASITVDSIMRCDPVIVTGTSLMDFDRIGREVKLVTQKGARSAMGSSLYESTSLTVPGKIAEHLELPIRILSLQTSCCSGLDAIGQAAELVASGQSDLAIAGGSEAPLSFHPLIEFNAAELSPVGCDRPDQACRPFDLWRSTGVLGEGAAVLILEPETSPRPGYAWIAGYGFANDPSGQAGLGIAEAVTMALSNASKRPSDVGYINAWGPGHRVIDANETAALRRVFGNHLEKISVSSIKGSIGTALAASGAIQTASTALSLQSGLIPPTVNWVSLDPQCMLNLSGTARYVYSSVAVVNAHGMSGTNSALVLEKTC